MKLVAAWSPEHSGAHSLAGPGCLKVCLCPTVLGVGPARVTEAGVNRPYLVVWSRRAGGGQGWARALLQGQPVPGVGGWGRGLPRARYVLGGTRRILASWQVLLPRVHLKKEEAKCQEEVSGKPVPTRDDGVPHQAWPVLSHTMALMALVGREAQLLTSPE